MHFNRFTGEYEDSVGDEYKIDYIIDYDPPAKKALMKKIKTAKAVKEIFDVSNNTKEKLLEDLFSMDNNDSVEELITLYNATELLMERTNATTDGQLKIVKRIALIMLLENQESSYEAFYNMAEPSIYYLLNNPFWTSTDVKLASVLSGHTIDFKTTKSFVEKTVNEARKEKDLDSELTAVFNALKRLILIKYEDLEHSPLEQGTTLEEVTQFFNFCLETANKIFSENDFPVMNATAIVREGIFFKDSKKVNSALKTLEDLGEDETVRMLTETIDEIFEINKEGE